MPTFRRVSAALGRGSLGRAVHTRPGCKRDSLCDLQTGNGCAPLGERHRGAAPDNWPGLYKVFSLRSVKA